ncbi:MAG: N-acetylmuramoyl-L-alanine amidase [Defluviitaleaceae bacterium]|nr:N-acetylmuramoyl-L-alanine amidase [Defluviitaleaceae bacterium]
MGQPYVRKRRRRRMFSRRFLVLVALMILGTSGYFIISALAVEGYEDTYETPPTPALPANSPTPTFVPIDITALRTDFDDASRTYHFYYEEGPVDMNRHHVVDPGGVVNQITYSPRYNRITIHTDVPSIFLTEYSPATGNVYINVAGPRELYDRIVIIDPGHGGEDSGPTVNGINESDLVLEISHRIYELFNQSSSGIKAFMTRHDDIFVSNSGRAHFGNAIGDLHVSVHANTFVQDTRVAGTETLFAPYSAMDRYGNSGRVDMDNATFAQIVQNYLVAELQTRNRGIVERDDLGLLNASTIPTALIEIDFMTNPEALANMLDPAYQQRVALAIYRSIVSAFGANNE